MTGPTRTDRRRARTRAALISAALQLLAEGRVEVSVQEITTRADVGLGSFYNHFTDKPELWAAAISAALAAHGALVAAVTEDVADPAEVFCIGLRLTGRMQRAFPELARALLHVGVVDIATDEGLAVHALRDISAGIDAGRFDIGDPRLALALSTAALLSLIQILDGDPDADADLLADDMAMRILLAFGVSRTEARRLVRRPLPALPAGEPAGSTV